jgi:hypothetical protein
VGTPLSLVDAEAQIRFELSISPKAMLEFKNDGINMLHVSIEKIVEAQADMPSSRLIFLKDNQLNYVFSLHSPSIDKNKLSMDYCFRVRKLMEYGVVLLEVNLMIVKFNLGTDVVTDGEEETTSEETRSEETTISEDNRRTNNRRIIRTGSSANLLSIKNLNSN